MDKRRACWVLKSQVREDIRECFRSDAAMFQALQTNSKTGGKILYGEPVKREVAKSFATLFLTFLREYESGETPLNSSRHFDEDVRKAISKYLKGADGSSWADLAEEVDSEA